MQTLLADYIKDTPQGSEAESILRRCTHCGFCLPNCPTYRLLGNELDSPRGRIYQIKQLLEGAPATDTHRLHLDRCLSCRACESSCPVGVPYGRLVDIGREIVARQLPHRQPARLQRALLRLVIPRRPLFTALLYLGRLAKPMLPASLREKIPSRRAPRAWPVKREHARRVLLLEGCVQQALSPSLSPHMATLLDRLEIETLRTPRAGCCGAVDQHLGSPATALKQARRNIDAWWPHVERGVDAIIVNASGCGTQVKEYGHLFRNDPDYADKAARISSLTVDPIELLERYREHLVPAREAPRRIAFQSPCSLQHGQKLGGRVETLLQSIGFTLTPVPDGHICCGSAGTYSVLQPDLAERLRTRKLENLSSGKPDIIATANIGCQTHLEAVAKVGVCHWLELIDVKMP